MSKYAYFLSFKRNTHKRTKKSHTNHYLYKLYKLIRNRIRIHSREYEVWNCNDRPFVNLFDLYIYILSIAWILFYTHSFGNEMNIFKKYLLTFSLTDEVNWSEIQATVKKRCVVMLLAVVSCNLIRRHRVKFKKKKTKSKKGKNWSWIENWVPINYIHIVYSPGVFFWCGFIDTLVCVCLNTKLYRML